MDVLEWLSQWFSSYCDEDWEHGYGIRIETLDNPGWSVLIALEGTNLENISFEKIAVDNNNSDWLICWVENGFFNGCGDLSKLRKIVEIFKEWSDSQAF